MKKAKNRTRCILYKWMFVGLWMHQKHHRITAVDMSRQKELDVDSKATQQIKFVGKLKNANGAIVGGESMFTLMILEKIKEARLKFFQGSGNYEEARVKLWNSQQNKLKSVAKTKTRTTLRNK